jgi:hypothetical protein
MNRIALLGSLGTVALLPFAACSSSTTPTVTNDDGGTDAKADRVTIGDDAPGDDGGPDLCATQHQCSGSPQNGQTCFAGLSTSLVDTGGTAVSGADVYVCGTDLCTSSVTSDAQGKVDIAQCLFMRNAAFKFPDDPKWAPFVTLLSGGGPEHTLPSVTVVPLPAQGVTMAQQAITSNNVTLSLTGVTFTFDIEHSTDDQKLYRAVEVPIDKAPPGIDPSLQLEVLWGLAPLNTTLRPSAQITFPNTKQWAAKAKVDLYLNGADGASLNPPAPWGTFAPMGTATVSIDGTKVVSDTGTGNGVPEIAMIGARLHP